MTKANETDVRIDLARDATLRLPRAGALVRVEKGTVLVTREGDQEDHVLEPGDELVVPRGGVAVAWAFTAAELSVRARHAARLPVAEPGRAA
jgi:hypothetical protein